MGERKVLNRYFPPDFDPAALPKRKRAQTNDMKVRMMLPMSVRCKTCGTFMYKGTKFNTRKEDVMGETYLGIQVYRFYYRCTHCGAEFTMKTDPKTSDYQLEEGATRNYEHWREEEKVTDEAKKAREEEEMGNAMKALENRTLDSKREMDIMAALDEMRTLNARHSKITTEEALAALQREADKQVGPDHVAEDVTDDLAEFYRLRRAAANQQLRDSDDDNEDGDDGNAGPSHRSGAASGGATGKSGRGTRAPGAGLSLAAAAMEDELEGDQEDSDHDPAHDQDPSNADQVQGTASGSGRQQTQDSHDAAGAGRLDTAGKVKEKAQLATLPQPSKPAAKPMFKVVSKPKPVVQATPASQDPVTDTPVDRGGSSDGEGAGLGGLLGGYGSSADSQ